MENKNVPQIVMVEGIHGFVDEKGVVWVKVEDVARGLGFMDVHFAKSGERWESVRWVRVNQYRADHYLPPVKSGDFIPENELYLLAMKANNETARKFQLKIANEILPQIRRSGFRFESDKGTSKESKLNAIGNALWGDLWTPMRPIPPRLACVYAFEMSDDTVKIGVATKPDTRQKQVAGSVYLEVKRTHQTAFAPRSFMYDVEKRCHAAFADRRVRGEFFDISFEEAVAELDSHADEIAAALRDADQRYLAELDYFFNEFLPEYDDDQDDFPAAPFDESKVRLLIDLLNVPLDSPLKETLFKEVANLLLGKDIF